jgi:hypothetical protein
MIELSDKIWAVYKIILYSFKLYQRLSNILVVKFGKYGLRSFAYESLYLPKLLIRMFVVFYFLGAQEQQIVHPGNGKGECLRV